MESFTNSNIFFAVLVGIGLSAACGFRIFVPLLAISIAAKTGHVHLSSGFEWMSSWTAITAFSAATILEIIAFYIPWFDNLMDSIATPSAVVAGTVLTSSMIADISPFLKWTLAIIAGGGTAALVQSGTVLLRGASTTVTGGFGNFIVSTFELVASIIASLLAISFPIICVLFIGITLLVIMKIFFRARKRHPKAREKQVPQVP